MANVAPTLLSTFEVLFTPQLPPGVGPTAVAQVDEMVVKGFFLTLCNPNPAAYTIQVGFHCNVKPSPVPAQRTLASAVGFLDDGTTGTALTLTATSATDFIADVTLSANGTVLIGVLPAFFTMNGLVSPTIESRGWVDLTLPALFRGGKFTFPEFVAQSATPIAILATPEQRLTFLPMQGDAAAAVEAQSAFALPTAPGGALITIPPQPTRLLLDATVPTTGVTTQDAAAVDALMRSSSGAQTAALAALLGATPAVSDGHRSVSQAMQDLGFKMDAD